MTRGMSTFSGRVLVLVGLGVLGLPGSVQAGFELVGPGSGASPVVAGEMASGAFPPVEALPVPVLPTPVVSERAPVARVMSPAPVPQQAPLVITSRPEGALSVKQDRKTAVYPPPGNAPAAPLSGSRVIAPSKAFATVETQAPSPVSSSGTSAIQWNSVPSQDSRVLPVVATPVDIEKGEALVSAPVISSAGPVLKSFPVLDGFGSDIPFDLALDQVVPKTYRVLYQDRPDRTMMVSWSGGRPWDAVLMDMLSAKGYRAAISGTTVTIMRSGGPEATGAASLAPSAGAALPGPMMSPEDKEGTVQDVSLVPDLPDETPVTHAFDGGKHDQFRAMAGDDLQDVLTAWSARAGVKLYWQADRSYTLSEDIALQTTFPRAVASVLKTFRGQAQHPVASLHPNAPKGPAVLAVSSQS